jgi:hypothetical protein
VYIFFLARCASLPFGAETLFVLPLLISPDEPDTIAPSNTHHTNRDATAIDRDKIAPSTVTVKPSTWC